MRIDAIRRAATTMSTRIVGTTATGSSYDSSREMSSLMQHATANFYGVQQQQFSAYSATGNYGQVHVTNFDNGNDDGSAQSYRDSVDVSTTRTPCGYFQGYQGDTTDGGGYFPSPPSTQLYINSNNDDLKTPLTPPFVPNNYGLSAPHHGYHSPSPDQHYGLKGLGHYDNWEQLQRAVLCRYEVEGGAAADQANDAERRSMGTSTKTSPEIYPWMRDSRQTGKQQRYQAANTLRSK